MQWAKTEMSEIDCGDARVDARAIMMIDKLVAGGEGSTLAQCFQSRKELTGAYRFFDNDLVTPEKILSAHYKSTLERIKQHPVVLLPSDTSSVDYTSKSTIEGLGILDSPLTRGLLIHPTLAVTPTRVPLGVVDFYFWARDENANRSSISSGERMNQVIEEKESFRWLRSYRKANAIAMQCPDTQIISMGDRENDIFEVLYEAVKEANNGGAHALIRLRHDRIVVLEGDDQEHKLKKKLLKAPRIGEIEFTLEERGKKEKRIVRQTLRAQSVLLKGKFVGEREYPAVRVNVVCSIEENPPPGEEPICWMFLTTLPIATFEEVAKVIQYYLCRWDIEVFFKVLKSGCKVEEKALKTAERLSNMLAMFLIVTWRIMYIMKLAREQPGITCTKLFEAAEWQSVYKILNKGSKLPTTPPSLGEFVAMIARLGGYLAGKKRPPPGPTVLWRGLKRVQDFALAWESFES